MRSVVFVDLDSTLADTTQRQYIITEAREAGLDVDWERYSQACSDDVPFPGPVQLVRVLHWSGYQIVIVSGRSEVARVRTLRWLHRHDVPYDEVILKPPGNDKVPNEEFKVAAIKEWIRRHPDHDDLIKPTLILEDWPPAKDRMEAEGWKVLLVNPDYDRSGLKV